MPATMNKLSDHGSSLLERAEHYIYVEKFAIRRLRARGVEKF